ncbi:protein transport protein Sec24C-like [Sinocyclocheilus anshuiensis]|uniref:protein transport protein Sec24C-like n=1 Tax=Sinocyclocheilus anshuiensis TaxID=1608454 RepID=UPI0007B8A01B|nr:PREDICTED: protein transport protein Sec24C-like [Sinocyclocheilus anshuiensis]
MDVPAVNQSYTHPPPQPWAGQSPRTPTMPSPSRAPPSYHYPNLNPDQQSVTPMTHMTGTSAGHRPHSLYWDPSQQSYQDVLKPVPEITNMTTQGMPQRNYSLPTSPVSNSKTESRYGLDPQLLPSVVHVIKENRIQWEGKVFVSESKSSVPPLSSTQCTLEDRGNATARFIRCTSYSFPVEAQSAQKSHLPLGAIVCPLARPEKGERDVPVCEAGDCVKGCAHCGAFMSPAMSWQDCGQRFYCPFCDKLTEVPWQSYQPTNQGRRVDCGKKPELSLGSYEILQKQSGKAAVLLLAIDVSASAVRTGQPDHICKQICSQLQALNGNSSGFFSSSKSIFQGPDSSISLAKECVSQGCSVHIFVFSHQEVRGAWPGNIPFLTGGGVICYNSLQSEMEQERFRADLSRCVNMQMAFKVQLRVFVSKEMRLSGCYGTFIADPDSCCVAMAALDWRTALAFEFTHNKSLDETRGVAIQFVLSYSNSSGENRTRIHTVILSASHQLLDTFRSSQAETLLTFYCKKMYSLALESPLQSLREELQTEVTEMLACFRKHSCTASVSPGQLVLPQFLKVVPVYINSLCKSEVLLPGLRSCVHQRLRLRSLIVSMDTLSAASQFYPLILPLSVSADNANMPSLGEAVRCTVSSLDPGGLYLIYCPLALLLWVGSCVPPHTLPQLFNTNSFSYLTSGEIKLPVLENSLSISTRALICSLQSSAAVTLQLKLVREGDSCEESL